MATKQALSTTHPAIAAEADGWDPATVTAGSGKARLWRCDLGHTWSATVSNRALRGSGCPVCAGKKVLAGFNDLATTHPALADQAHGWDPATVNAGSHKRRDWRCTEGHTWTAEVKSRAHGNGCPVCAGKKVLAGFNDLATTHPALADQADGWDPATVNAGSQQKRDWRCAKGHTWIATVASRAQGNGCPYCAGKKVLAGFNDLATTHPALADQAHGWDPATVNAGSHKGRDWRCTEGHTWTAPPKSRVRGYGCPYCAGQRTLTGFNDLATTHPALADQADGWDPTTVNAGSQQSRLWRCVLGHAWSARVSNRTANSSGCPYCSGREVLTGFNDLATTHPALADQAHGWDPATVNAGSHKRRDWRCTEGHTWTAEVKSRTQGSGCPSCSRSGFDPNDRGWVYLVRNDRLGLLQIGISNVPEMRLSRHTRGGWEYVDLNGPLDGATAREFERHFLAFLDATSVPRAHAFSEQFDGYTESWRVEDLCITSLSEARALLQDWEGRPQE